ncbi:MAG: isoleucine--tRNA ligase [Bdellovibrionales bacterium]|nr:isoleucine--tRNA ligase [Bdellovibrionales bacterium]
MSSPGKKSFEPVRPDVNLPAEEERILKFWDEKQIFEKSVTARKNAKAYSFYDGPPFATGLPHYGHLLAGTLKDVVPRYWTMKGYSIPRRFGWDCHGLPVENEINKTHNIKSNKDVLAMGVANYNAACRGIVSRYSEEWKRTVKRIGRWVDMENAYFTMSPDFMESVWWVFKQIYDKGLMYEGYKVVPYSTGLSTGLSNFEANSNYKQVQDPAITVAFPIKEKPGVSFLAWTTTPWTLPSNLGLAVHSDADYVRVREKNPAEGKTSQEFILAKALWKNPFGKEAEKNYEVVEEMKGSALLGLHYEPLFPFFADKANEGAFKVIHSDHVTMDSGVGVVHMAPAFGEEDYYACQKNGIPLVNPVDDDGMFTAAVGPYAGKRVKDADKDLIAEIKAKGRLVKHDTIVHSYPFCPRTDTPLIYRAITSWFVRVEKVKETLLAANAKTTWVPEHLRDGRFGNWLENARDWAISRNRFWGTPLPIWKNDEGEMICVGSREELEALSGKKIGDLHKESIDSITIPSKTGKSPLKRIAPVLDCWFESGSMPYAQWGYPKKNKAEFEKSYPADFIAEGLDQTRGWFYTLSVIGAILEGKSPFKNVVVNGLILAEDGKKMSKSLKNYPDPMGVLDRHGADALRLYMINSPVVKAEELRFAEKGVTEVVRKILLRWWNSYAFFVNYANVDGFVPAADPKGKYAPSKSPNELDRWILSRLNSLIRNTEREMEHYRLYNVVPHLVGFVEDLTNTYIRFNRSHFWANGMPDDKRFAYETLYHVLVTLSKVMAPFAPFVSETIFLNLKTPLAASAESVHLEDFPTSDEKAIHPELEEAVRVMDALVTLGRNHREKIKVKAKIPLLSMKVIHREKRVLENLKKFEPYFKDELNIRKIEYVSNEDDFVAITAKANFPVLGKRLGAKMKQVGNGIAALKLADLLKLEAGETLAVEGEKVTLADIDLRRAPKGENPNLSVDALVSIEVDPTVTKEQEAEGYLRTLTRAVNQKRKLENLNLDDKIAITFPKAFAPIVAIDEKFLVSETLAKSISYGESTPPAEFGDLEIEDLVKLIALKRV